MAKNQSKPVDNQVTPAVTETEQNTLQTEQNSVVEKENNSPVEGDPDHQKVEIKTPVMAILPDGLDYLKNVETSIVTPEVLVVEQNTLQTEQNVPIKPVLTDQVVYQDFSQSDSVNIENEQGVKVALSGTAASILKKLDANTKIVE
ncbi:hypothetical protein [Chryseobacterium viscerum]|uniref:Uncharacterized protein n=1 Tax=Chryseobacterium viscerum TaxID=1037377 RepID=A0A5N4BJ28_9FLAO|nr:hypothetical protein [Chryseobacterium viscerum]KAB1228452.1 hypothetical protein F8D52_22515 [Chryseobacterium viscerum]